MLQPFLGRLIPVLLKNMVYDEYDEEVSEAEAAEEAALSGQAPSEEREQEVKPFIARCGLDFSRVSDGPHHLIVPLCSACGWCLQQYAKGVQVTMISRASRLGTRCVAGLLPTMTYVKPGGLLHVLRLTWQASAACLA